MTLQLTVRYLGGVAEDNKIPAYDGATSIVGIARSITIISHYAAVGKIRRRTPFSDDVKLFISPFGQGSFEAELSAIFSGTVTSFGGLVAVQFTGIALYEFVRGVLKRAVGSDADQDVAVVSAIERQRPGDVDALVDAIEPALRNAHGVINQGVNNIVIVSGDNNIVNFNGNTKRYLTSTTLNENDEWQDVSISAFNVNTLNGRAYIYDLSRTVPFTISSNAETGTIEALAGSLNDYANNRGGDISIRFRRYLSLDGETKRILVYEVAEARD